MNETEKILYDDLTSHFDETVRLRRYFHSHPELSKQEYNTQKKIEDYLKQLGLEVHETAGTGVYSTIEGKKGEGKTIVLRADIDALPVTEQHHTSYESTVPGVMHACGHDAHTAALLSAARVLKEHQDLFPGKVLLVFQPGEEVGYGGREIVKEGVIDGADRTFGIHMASYLPVGMAAIVPGAENASVDQFRIVIHGKGAHISAPQAGADAAYIAARILTEGKNLVAELDDPMTPSLLGIGRIQAGTSYNVIADEGEIEGTLRCFDQNSRQKILKAFAELIHHTAELYGGTAEFFNKDNTAVLINDPESAAEVQKTAASVFGRESVICHRKPSLAGDDMAEFINRVPGAYAYVGSGNPDIPETTVSHHNSHFDIDEDALKVASGLYACYAADYLNGIYA